MLRFMGLQRVRRLPGTGEANPLQCSCLENSMDRGAWQATVHRATESQTRLSNYEDVAGYTGMLVFIM